MNELLERLAELEHEQWVYWSKGVSGDVSPARLKRWEKLWATPYAELDEGYKADDRRHARKVLAVLKVGDFVKVRSRIINNYGADVSRDFVIGPGEVATVKAVFRDVRTVELQNGDLLSTHNASNLIPLVSEMVPAPGFGEDDE